MNFQITILGSGAATPTLKRSPSGQLVCIHDKLLLVDCGEGTQLQLRKFKIKFQKIQHIFISHLHGDHYLGLPGLMSSMHLLGRTSTLHVYGPPDLKELLELNLRVSDTYLNFPWHYNAIEKNFAGKIMEDNSMEVHTFPLKHRIQCHGYMFREKPRKSRVRKDAVEEFGLGFEQIKQIKRGEDAVMDDGTIIPFPEVGEWPHAPRTYAYCSDTTYNPDLVPFITGSSLLYHESTFLDEHRKRAAETYHTTAAQAAAIARDSRSVRLMLGHFSSRYTRTQEFIEEASAVFSNVFLAEDGLVVDIPVNFEESRTF